MFASKDVCGWKQKGGIVCGGLRPPHLLATNLLQDVLRDTFAEQIATDEGRGGGKRERTTCEHLPPLLSLSQEDPQREKKRARTARSIMDEGAGEEGAKVCVCVCVCLCVCVCVCSIGVH